MYITGSGVGYNGETITKLGIGEYVTFENCTFTATNGERISGSGNDACIQFFGPGIVVNGGSVTGTDWQGQFMGLYGSANVTFYNKRKNSWKEGEAYVLYELRPRTEGGHKILLVLRGAR